MKRLSLLVAAAAAALAMFAMPVLAALPDDGVSTVERLDCPVAALSAADFAVTVVSPAVEQFMLTPAPASPTAWGPVCDAALLAETGLCIVSVAPARVSFAFAWPPDPAVPPVAGICLGDRSTTG